MLKKNQVDKVLEVLPWISDLTKGGAKALKKDGFWTSERGEHFTLRRFHGKQKKTDKAGLVDNDPKNNKVGGLPGGTEGSAELPVRDVVPATVQTENKSED